MNEDTYNRNLKRNVTNKRKIILIDKINFKYLPHYFTLLFKIVRITFELLLNLSLKNDVIAD
jgi:hypothetical protein